MNTYLYRLTFTGPVHFGASGIGMENSHVTLTSDALTSALINALCVLGKADETVEILRGDNPGFILSSLFLYQRSGDGTVHYALPKPLCKPPVDNETIQNMGKEIKKIQYLCPEDTHMWLGDDRLSLDDISQIKTRSESLIKTAYEEELRPRVALDRQSSNSSFWRCGVIHFKKGAGLFGLVHIRDNAWKSVLESAFRMLGDLGLGGERTYGFGTFEFSGFETPPASWFKKERNQKRYMLLSSYYPNSKEKPHIRDIFAAWNFFENRGYIVSGRNTTTFKRKRLRMFSEGSVVHQPVRGMLVDVTPDDAQALGLSHRVYRTGLAFLFPWRDA